MWKKALLVALLASAISVEAGAQEKVAVLVSGGDLGSLEDSMKRLEQEATSVYQELGYRVVVVGGVNEPGAPFSWQSLDKTLSDLRDVKDLRLDFLGHGSLQTVPDRIYQGKSVPVSPARRENSYESLNPKPNERIVWLAGNSSTADAADHYFVHKAEVFGFKAEKLTPISQQRVADALEHFRGQNKDALATVNFLNCFSGAMAQELRKTPNTVVYANSPHNQTAISVSEGVHSFFLGQQSGTKLIFKLASPSASGKSSRHKEVKRLSTVPYGDSAH